MTILFASLTRFRDAVGAFPKTQYVLGTGQGGGDGMQFVTGNEVFQWSSETVPSGVRPRRIISLWVDASGLGSGGSVSIHTPTQRITLPTGNQSQGYVIVTLNAPFTIVVSAIGGPTGTLNITAYDYNANYTGMQETNPYAQNQGGGSGGAAPVAAGRRATTR